VAPGLDGELPYLAVTHVADKAVVHENFQAAHLDIAFGLAGETDRGGDGFQ
jgi:hypothetical protein